jgi:hypothetical protein
MVMSNREDVPVVVIEDGTIHRESENALPEVRGRFVYKWFTGTPSETTDGLSSVYQKYVRLLSGEEVEGWGRLPNKSLLFIDLGLGKPDILFNDDQWDELEKWLGDSHNVGREREGGIYLIACAAIKNSDWSGTIVVASERGAANKIVEEPLERICKMAAGRVIIKDGGASFGSRHWRIAMEKGFRAHEEQFGDRLGAFLEKMSLLTSKDCHNWDTGGSAPVQFQNLSSLLGAQPDELARMVGMDAYPNIGHPEGHGHIIPECLKTFGTSDQTVFTPLASLLVAWAAYRELHGEEGKGNKYFADAIKNFKYVKPAADGADPCKNGSVCVAQTPEERNESIDLFYNLMKAVLRSDADYRDQGLAQGEDTLTNVTLNKDGVSFTLMVNPLELSRKLVKTRRRLLSDTSGGTDRSRSADAGNVHSTRSHGSVSERILRFVLHSSITVVEEVGEFEESPEPYFGCDFPVHLYPEGHHTKLAFERK